MPALSGERGRSNARDPGYRQTRSFTCGYVAALSVARMFRPKVSAAKLYRRIQPTSAGARIRRRFDVAYGSAAWAVRCVEISPSPRSRLQLRWFSIITLTKTTLPETCIGSRDLRCRSTTQSVFVSGYQLFRSTVFRWPEFHARWADPGFGIVCWGL